jgi:hypothetical protein
VSYLQTVSCPSCGANHDIRDPSVLQITCSYCSTIYIWDKESVQLIGKQSKLVPPLSGLSLNTEVQIKGKSYFTRGRVSNSYLDEEDNTTRGNFEEWYLVDSDYSQKLFITEDMGKFTLESELNSGIDLLVNEIQVGQTLNISSISFTVVEKNYIRTMGTEGELPYQVLPQEEYYSFDLKTNDGRFATLEFDKEDGNPTIYLGTSLNSNEIKYQKVEAVSSVQSGDALRCPNCGAPVEKSSIKSPEQTSNCSSCNSILAIQSEVITLLGKNQEVENFSLSLGAKGELKGKEWTIISRIKYQWDVRGETGNDSEYILYDGGSSYSFISESAGHFYFYDPANKTPESDLSAYFDIPKQKVKVDSDTYLYYERGYHRIVYIDGALPWIAKVNDKVEYTDVIKPPFLYSQERHFTSNNEIKEIEYSLSEYIPYLDIYTSFGQEISAIPYTVGAAEPYKPLPKEGLVKWLSIFVGILFLGSTCFGGGDSKQILKEEFNLYQIQKKEILTSPFQVSKADEALEIRLKANVKNSWVGLGVAIYDVAKQEVMAADDVGVEYYEGYEDGESWSEGSTEEVIYWKVKDPGQYKLLITSPESETSSGTKVGVTIYNGATRVYPNLIVSMLWFLFAGILFWKKRNFESKRWADVIDDGDDDSDSSDSDDD